MSNRQTVSTSIDGVVPAMVQTMHGPLSYSDAVRGRQSPVPGQVSTLRSEPPTAQPQTHAGHPAGAKAKMVDYDSADALDDPSTSEEELRNREMRNGDSMYRGAKQSRIQSAQDFRQPTSPVVTRGMRSATKGTSVKEDTNRPPTKVQPKKKKSSKFIEDADDSDPSPKPSVTRKRKRSHAPRSTTVDQNVKDTLSAVDVSDSEVEIQGPFVGSSVSAQSRTAPATDSKRPNGLGNERVGENGISPSMRSRHRRGVQPDGPILSDESDLPTALEFLGYQKNDYRSRKKRATLSSHPSENIFIDNEAAVSDNEASDVSMTSERDDAYDLDDPFIDDSPLPRSRGSKKSRNHRRTSPKARGGGSRVKNGRTWNVVRRGGKPNSRSGRMGYGRRSTAKHESDSDSPHENHTSDLDEPMDIDGVFPGVEEEDPIVTTHKERYRRLKQQEEDLYGVSVAVNNHQSFVLNALGNLEDQRVYNEHDLVDDDRQLELARRMSLKEHILQKQHDALASDSRRRKKPEGESNATPGNVNQFKGKGKARATVEPEIKVEKTEATEDRDLQKAMLASLSDRRSTTSAGESSSTVIEDTKTPPPTTNPSAFKTSTPAQPSTPQTSSPQSPTTPRTPKTSPGRRRMADRVAASVPTGCTPGGDTDTSSPKSQGPAKDAHVRVHCYQTPDRCLVNQPILQDKLLAYQYVNNPPLRDGCAFIPWMKAGGQGQVTYSGWGEQIPDMDPDLAEAALNFVDAFNFFNPSRATPLRVPVKEMSGTSPRFSLYHGNLPRIAVSCGFLEFSQVLVPSTTGMNQKFVRIIFHTQEWERFVAWACMVFGHTELHAQVARDILQISTRGTYSSPQAKSGSNNKFSKMFAKQGGSGSPSTYGNKVFSDAYSLSNEDQVPVYDARDASDFNFDTDLPNLDKLPRWKYEIPYGSFVVVGYTMNVYKSGVGNWTLGCNLLWVMIIGIPSESNDSDA